MNSSVNVLVEAKKEYTTELQKILTPRLYEGFKSIYDDIIDMVTKELEQTKTQNSSIVKTFQKMLKEIPQWNQDMIKNEYNRIEQLSNCDYIDNLIEAVFITNTKILTSVQINDSKSQNVKINIPQPSYFVHRCYIECAKEIYKNPYIFDNSKGLTPKEKHTNLRESIHMIESSIDNAIRNLLPIRDILKHGLTKNIVEIEENKEPEDVNEEEDSEEEENDNEEDDNDEDDNEEDDQEEDDQEEEIKLENTNNSPVKNIEDVNIENNDDIESSKEIKEDVEENNLSEESSDQIELNKVNPSEIIDNSFPLSSLPAPKISLNNSIVLDEVNLDEVKESGQELKEIVYSTKLEPTFPKRLDTIEKIDEESQSSVTKSVAASVTKITSPIKSNILQYNSLAKPQFVKKVNISKFVKGKKTGGDNSFYKKKYEENLANYESMTDKNNDNLTAVSDVTMTSVNSSVPTIDTRMVQQYKEEVKNVDLRNISRNKIMLDGVSEDDEEDEDELEL
jgi:hypothetical protein